MRKPRVLYLLREYPQLSQTYVQTELDAVRADFDVRILHLRRPDRPARRRDPSLRLKRDWLLRAAIRLYRPDLLHTHFLTEVPRLFRLSGDLPFTVRSHSFDVLEAAPAELRAVAPMLNDARCLGALAFPFARPRLEAAGVAPEKIRDCFPVVDVSRFLDESPNGEGVMNVGACIPKKRMEDFLDLARAVPGIPFRLYAMGYRSGEIEERNRALGSPVEIVPPREPEEMPREYKRHRWLVYTADRAASSVGWSMAVAEAQASGVGVCFPNLRTDLTSYVGEAGYLYDSIAEVAEIVRRPFPEERRALGFELARRSDVRGHIAKLTELWRGALRDSIPAPASPPEGSAPSRPPAPS